jgi:MFS transporter, putative metabolite:H+ symporter
VSVREGEISSGADTIAAGRYAGEVAARLDRLPFARTLWRFVLLISLGGIFELYDLFMTAYIAPGLVSSGLFTSTPAGFFDPRGVGFFVFCTFAGMWVGCIGFGFIADRLGRRSIFTFSLVWYSLATAVMALQSTAETVDLWRFIAAIGVGLEQITIDTFLPELVPPRHRGRAFAYYQFIEFCVVPVVALLGWLLGRPHRLRRGHRGLVAAPGPARESALARAAWPGRACRSDHAGYRDTRRARRRR